MSKLVDGAADPAIPTLATVLNPTELARRLSGLGFPQRHWDLSQGTRITVLKWKRASRCTVEICPNNGSGGEELIGKVYAEDRSDILRTMNELWQAGFADGAEFAVPRGVDFVVPLRLLLYEKVAGTRARNLIVGSNGAERLRALEQCARWLVCFQAKAPRWGRPFSPRQYLEEFQQSSPELESSWLPVADKAKTLVEQLTAMLPYLDGSEMCAGHGMYTCGQVLLAGSRSITIDWDTFNLADPAHDVARFLVDLQRMALKYFGSLKALDQAGAIFLNAYVSGAGPCDALSLAFYRAAICLERASSDVKKQNPGWRERAEAMLDEGLNIL
jgi:aminoglycoside phosphotransferase (APT) family kinase protein